MTFGGSYPKLCVPLPVSKNWSNDSPSSQVSFTLYKIVSKPEWEHFLRNNGGINKQILPLNVNRPEQVIPISHYSYQVQHPVRKNYISSHQPLTKIPPVPSLVSNRIKQTSDRQPGTTTYLCFKSL